VAVSRASCEAFVAIPTAAAPPMLTATSDGPSAVRMCLQARLPNGVVVDLRDVELLHASEVIQALGRVRCSDSTKP